MAFRRILWAIAFINAIGYVYGQCPGPMTITVGQPSPSSVALSFPVPDSTTRVQSVVAAEWTLSFPAVGNGITSISTPLPATYDLAFPPVGNGQTIVGTPSISSVSLSFPPIGNGLTTIASWSLNTTTISFPAPGNGVTQLSSVSPAEYGLSFPVPGNGTTAVSSPSIGITTISFPLPPNSTTATQSWNVDTFSLPFPPAPNNTTAVANPTPGQTLLTFPVPSQSTQVSAVSLSLTALTDTGQKQICSIFPLFAMHGWVEPFPNGYLLRWEADGDLLITHYHLLTLLNNHQWQPITTLLAKQQSYATYEYFYWQDDGTPEAFAIQAYRDQHLQQELILPVPSLPAKPYVHLLTPVVHDGLLRLTVRGLTGPVRLTGHIYYPDGRLAMHFRKRVRPSENEIQIPVHRLGNGLYLLEIQMDSHKAIFLFSVLSG